MAAVPRQTVSRPRDEALIADAERLFGRTLTNVIAAGVWTAARAGSLVADPLDETAARRLREALAVADLLLEAEAADTVRAWFAGKNPILGDRAPAVVIAEDPDKVRFAARDLLAHG